MYNVRDSRKIYDGFFGFREDLIEGEDGRSYRFCCLEAKADGVAVLAQPSLDSYLLCEEYRHPLKRTVLSLPGGRLDKNEDLLQGAHRELLEETGYEFERMRLLGSFYPFPSVSDQKVFLFHASIPTKKGTPRLDPLERIQLKIMKKQDLVDRIKNHEVLDSNIAVALSYLSLLES